MKRILALVLALALVFALAGCGKNEGTNNDTDGGNFKESTFKMPDYKPTADQVTMLTSMDNSMLDDPNQWYYSFNEKLKQQYGISINHLTVTAAELPVRASQLVLSDDSPDLIEYRDQDDPIFIRNGIVQSVDDLFDFEHPLYKHLKEANEKFRYKDGKNYTFIRNYRNNGFCYYWLEDLAELGLETPRELYYKGEWTWSKFEEYANKLTVKGTDQTVSRHGAVVNSNLMHTSTGETLVKYENGEYINNLRSSKLADYYGMISRMTFETKVMPSNVTLWDHFKAHKASIALDMRNLLDNHLKEELPNGWVSFSPIPKWEGTDKYYSPAGYGCAWIAKGAKNLDGARAWYATYILLTSDVDPEIAASVEAFSRASNGLDDEDLALIKEMNDTSKFELVQIRDRGLGTNWSAKERSEFVNSVVKWGQSWPNAVEKYYKLLDAAINESK